MSNDWTDDQIKILTNEYNKGTNARKIGNMIGHNRNAVIGKAYRLGLSHPIEIKDIEKTNLNNDDRNKKMSYDCQYPIGEPGNKDFHYCGEERLNASVPYCEEHCNICYRGKIDVNKEINNNIKKEFDT